MGCVTCPPATVHPTDESAGRVNRVGSVDGDRARAPGGAGRRGSGAGILSSTVGVASLLSFPVLVAVGLPPVVANASNTVGLAPGGLSGSFGYRDELRAHPAATMAVLVTCAVGAVARCRAAARPCRRGLRGGRAVADPLHLPARRRAAADLRVAAPPARRRHRRPPDAEMSPVDDVLRDPDRACTAATSARAPGVMMMAVLGARPRPGAPGRQRTQDAVGAGPPTWSPGVDLRRASREPRRGTAVVLLAAGSRRRWLRRRPGRPPAARRPRSASGSSSRASSPAVALRRR